MNCISAANTDREFIRVFFWQDYQIFYGLKNLFTQNTSFHNIITINRFKFIHYCDILGNLFKSTFLMKSFRSTGFIFTSLYIIILSF